MNSFGRTMEFIGGCGPIVIYNSCACIDNFSRNDILRKEGGGVLWLRISTKLKSLSLKNSIP